MSAMCLSAIGESVSSPILNRYRNTSKTIADVSNVLATCTLANYGESQGKRCGSCCFEDLPVTAKINALVLHNCETGEIIDFQCPPLGLTCDDDQYCVDMTCWSLSPACEKADDEEISFDMCEDPCVVCSKLELLMLNCVKGQWISWKNANKSLSRDRFNPDLAEKLLNRYRAKCRESLCMPSRSGLAFRPRC